MTRQEALKNNIKIYDGPPCKDCNEIERLTHNSACVACVPFNRRRMALWRNYKLTIEQWDQKWRTQGMACASCNKKFPFRSGQLCVDHDHIIGINRALLCHPCNIIVGIAREDFEHLIFVSEYIKTIQNSSYITHW